MNYTELVSDKDSEGSIRNWINLSTIPAATVLGEAEEWIYERLRVDDMIAVDESIATVVGADTLTVPTGFLAPISFWITGTEYAEIELVDPVVIERELKYDASGTRENAKPNKYYRRGSLLQLSDTADAIYTTRLVFHKAQTALSATNENNFLTDRWSRLLRCCCMAFAAEFDKDDEEKRHWLTVAEAEIRDRKAMADMDNVTGAHAYQGY